MCARRHTELVRAGCQTERLASSCRDVSDAIAFLLVILTTAAILALAGLAIAGVLHATAWVVAR